MRLVIATLTLSLATAVVAGPAYASSFERNGSLYEYSRTDKADGVVLIDGRAPGEGTSFSLRVDADHVTGTVDGRPVAFMISKETMAALSSERPTAVSSK